jgi:hypothetical protein
MKRCDNEEQLKWWDVIDALGVAWDVVHVKEAVEMARECRHPEAQWVASLFPVDEAVTVPRFQEVMREQGEDARAMHLESSTR